MSSSIVDELRDSLGSDRVLTDALALTAAATDTWPLRLVQAAVGAPRADRPLCVLRPRSAAEVATALKVLYARGVAVVPRGSGSGITGGAEPRAGSVVLDTQDMNQILELDEINLRVTAQAGVGLAKLEAWLNERGYVAGHYPQSIDLANLGGLVATRSAGQHSTRYGGIEDLVLALEAVLPDGTLVRVDGSPRRASGPDLRHVFIGSEGAFGVITEVTLKVFPRPADTWRCAFAVQTMRGGLEVMRQVVRDGWRPAVLRLYDPIETQRGFPDVADKGSCLLVALAEGPTGLPALEGATISRIAETAAAQPLGERPVLAWLEHRNDVSAFRQMVDSGLIFDAIDVGGPWTRIADIYESVLAALGRDVPELIVASAHASHAYPQGTNLYFVVGAKPPRDAQAVERVYNRLWASAMQAVLDSGGSICHHHGLGKLRTPWVQAELGSGYELLMRLKTALDPRGQMNPGTLVP